MQVLTALVHEQATQGIDHGLSDAMVGLLSQYHDRAWCRPTYQQRRLYNAAVLGSLADLPDTAVAIILQQLRPGDIMRLDAATMAQVPLIHERLLQMRYARRWLQLTRRVPAAGRTPCVEEVDVDSDPCKTDLCPTEHDFQADYRDFLEEAEEDNHSHQLRHPCMHYFDERLWGQLKHASKHSLLQTLLQQIRHINDVAALIDEWVPAHDRLWAYKNRHMDNWRPLPRTIWLPESIRRMRQLQYKVVLALSIGFVGFWDSAGEQTIHNKAGHCEFAAFGALMKPLNRLKNNQLLFLCALHRLQQLPAQAVLARLHGIFSRCCRFDLLMLVNSLAHRRQYVEGAIWPEAHAEDILIAFGGMTRDLPYMKTVDCLTVEEKEQIKQHTGSMVGEWVEMASIWDAFGSLLNNPILSPSWWPRSGDFHNTPAWQLQA